MFRFARGSLIAIIAEGRMKHFHVRFQSFFYINFRRDIAFRYGLYKPWIYIFSDFVELHRLRYICRRRNFINNSYRKKAATKYTGPEMNPTRSNPQLWNELYMDLNS